MKTLEAKPFDQNVENWKRENRLFTSTVLEAGASGQNRIGTHALRSHRRSMIRFRCSNSCFLLETGIAGHERLLLAKWHPEAEKKLRKRPFFDTADRHEKLYGRSRLYASDQWRHETGGILSLFSSLSFDISIKNSAQRWSSDFQGLFRVKIRKMAQGSNDLSTLPLISIGGTKVLNLKVEGGQQEMTGVMMQNLNSLTAHFFCLLSKRKRPEGRWKRVRELDDCEADTHGQWWKHRSQENGLAWGVYSYFTS